MHSKFDFSEFNELVYQGVDTAVIDIDNTITHSHIGMLLLHLKRKEFKSIALWYAWYFQFFLTCMLPLILLDFFSRNMAQKMTYRLYRQFDIQALETGANELFNTTLKKRFIPFVHDLIFHLKSRNVRVILLSTNLEVLAKQYSEYFNCEYLALPKEVVYSDEAQKVWIDSDFKKTMVQNYNPKKTLAIADSKHDASVFNHARYSAIVCKKEKPWMSQFDAQLIAI